MRHNAHSLRSYNFLGRYARNRIVLARYYNNLCRNREDVKRNSDRFGGDKLAVSDQLYGDRVIET